jgi:hypothetical protein
MIMVEVFIRLVKALGLLSSFAIISCINGMLIRVAIKCSVLCIFPMLSIYECVSRRRLNPRITALIYRQMGTHGAMAAYLDRNRRSKDGLILSIFFALMIYYVMYMASYTFWDQITFN